MYPLPPPNTTLTRLIISNTLLLLAPLTLTDTRWPLEHETPAELPPHSPTTVAFTAPTLIYTPPLTPNTSNRFPLKDSCCTIPLGRVGTSHNTRRRRSASLPFKITPRTSVFPPGLLLVPMPLNTHRTSLYSRRSPSPTSIDTAAPPSCTAPPPLNTAPSNTSSTSNTSAPSNPLDSPFPVASTPSS